MPQRPLDVDLKAQLECSLRLTLEYLITHAHLRALFTIQEMLSRHAADAAWSQSQQALGPLPKDYQEMPAVLRLQLAEMEKQSQALRAMQAPANLTPAQYLEARDVLSRETQER